MEEAGPGLGLEVPPEVVGAAQEGHVARVLGVGQPDDSRVAVARAAAVAGLELLEAQAGGAGLGEVVEGGAAHGAELPMSCPPRRTFWGTSSKGT